VDAIASSGLATPGFKQKNILDLKDCKVKNQAAEIYDSPF
jgi:hypothetical protein